MSKTITVYSPAELKESNPDGFENALEWWRSTNDEIPWQGEIMDSFKAIFKASGLYIRDWTIDAYGYSSVKFDMDSDVQELAGNRALAWIENNLLSDLRIPFVPMFINYDEYEFKHHKGWKPTPKRGALSQYGEYYRPGMIKPCPFTGVCFDEDFIESLLKSIKSGDTLGEAYSNLAYVAGKLFESEIEYLNSEECFLEQEHLEFTEDGHII